jgi:hypothetical protein
LVPTICERHRVPTPPRGYWAKLEAGAKPKKAVFVEASAEALNVIEINPTLSTAKSAVGERKSDEIL